MRYLILMLLLATAVSFDAAAQTYSFKSVMVSGTNALSDLTDVSETTPTEGQVLSWNNTTASWQPSATVTGADNLGDHTATQALNLGGFDISNTATVSATLLYSPMIELDGVAGAVPTSVAIVSGGDTLNGLTDVTASDSDGNIMVGTGGGFVMESGATARASLGLTIGTNVQAYDAQLADIAGITPSTNQILAWDGANWTASTTTVSSGADNLGSHTATTDLNLSSNNITNAADITASGDVTADAINLASSPTSACSSAGDVGKIRWNSTLGMPEVCILE